MIRRLAPEWEKQDAVLLAWPQAKSGWGNTLHAVEQNYLQVIKAISRYEKVMVLCKDLQQQIQIESKLTLVHGHTEQVRYFLCPTNDSWIRDYGPICVRENEQYLVLDFEFNAWGEKYDYALDNQVNRKLHQLGCFGNAGIKSIRWVLEGGSIEVDGQGTLLTTRSCLINAKRNPHLSPQQLESQLSTELGIHRIHWLSGVDLAGDDTDGHIDNLARFCNAQRIAYSQCDNPGDRHFNSLMQMHTELQRLKDHNGQAYELVPLPLPKGVYSDSGQRLPASYANFLIINGAVLLPIFEDEHDELAAERLQYCFPDRDIVTINCRAIIEQYGGLHCMSMQLPYGSVFHTDRNQTELI